MRDYFLLFVIVLVFISGVVEQYVPTLGFYGLLALSSLVFLNLRFSAGLSFLFFLIFDYLLLVSFFYDKLPDYIFELYFLFFLCLWILQFNKTNHNYNVLFVNKVLLFLFFVSGVIGVLQRFGYYPLISDGLRPMGLTSGPLTYGWIMSLSLLFLGSRFSVLINISVFFFGLLIAFFVGSKLFLLVSIISFISYLSYLLVSVRLFLVKLSAIVFIGFAIFFLFPVLYNIISYLLSPEALTSAGRFDRYYRAMTYIYENPFGAGVGTFGSVANNFGDAFGSSESFFLYILGQVGMPIGLFLLTIFLLRIPVWSVPVIFGFIFTEAIISIPAWVFTFAVYSYSKNSLFYWFDFSLYRMISARLTSSYR